MKVCQELSSLYEDGIVFIGGIAVYLHCVNQESLKKLGEFTHDGDFYISIADMGDLRDIEEVYPNRKLNRHQIKKDGFEFDIYTERHSSLIVPYDHIRAHAIEYEHLKVACEEHLLCLKLEAFLDRKNSPKGSKDAKDIIRLGLCAYQKRKKFKTQLAEGFLRDDHLDALKEIAKGSEFLNLTLGNSKEAKEMRKCFTEAISSIL